jgi:hypothetical protein
VHQEQRVLRVLEIQHLMQPQIVAEAEALETTLIHPTQQHQVQVVQELL